MKLEREHVLSIVRGVINALNARDWTTLAALTDAARSDHFRTSPLLSAFPDIRIEIDAQFADGDYVITRWTNRATHTAPYLDIPPTYRAVQFTGISIDRIVDGKIAESWNESDMIGLFEQLGRVLQHPSQP